MVTDGHYLDDELSFSSKYGAIVERYMLSCHHLPALLIFDFTADAIYHSNLCGDKLTPNEIEKFISDFNEGKLTPTGQLNADNTLIPYRGKFWWGKNWRIWRIMSYLPRQYLQIH